MYKSEKAFSNAFLKQLKIHCPFIQRIESAIVGRGIPDIYCRWPSRELWIELKNKPQVVFGVPTKHLVVDWRVGQQAWHYNYYRTTGKSVLTVVAISDGFLVVPLRKIHKNNEVLWNCVRYYCDYDALIKAVLEEQR